MLVNNKIVTSDGRDGEKLCSRPGKRSLAKPERGCVEDQPQRHRVLRPSGIRYASDLWTILRLVLDTAAVRFA
jgi:hypothetical protein